MKPAEQGEGDMPVTAAVLQVSAAGCCESTAALPAVGLPLVLILLSLVSVSLPPACSTFQTRTAKLSHG